MQRGFYILTLTIIISTLAYIVSTLYIYKANDNAIVLVEPNDHAQRIASKLKKQSIVHNDSLTKWAFKVYLKLGGKIAAGEYYIPQGANWLEVVQTITSAKVFMRQVTIPEGLTKYQIVKIIENSFGVVSSDTNSFKEGYLMPDSYSYIYGDTVESIMLRMQGAMENFIKQYWFSRTGDSLILKDPNELLTLASIVEKETALEHEKPKVAQVYLNRLKKGMLLQADPTVIYAITNGEINLGRKLSYKDLKLDSPYNTYRYLGLPPSPIANPSRSSIMAVLNPLPSNELYFVARKDGSHEFAESYSKHLANVKTHRASY